MAGSCSHGVYWVEGDNKYKGCYPTCLYKVLWTFGIDVVSGCLGNIAEKL